VPSDGGNHGHLTWTITAAQQYLMLTNIPFPQPVTLPPAPHIPLPISAAQASEIVWQHLEDKRAFAQYYDTDKALVQLIIAAKPIMYIKALSDNNYGYTDVTTLQLLTHLQTMHGTVTPVNCELNLAMMHSPWMTPIPIKRLFKQLKEGWRFAATNAKAIANSRLAQIGFQLMVKPACSLLTVAVIGVSSLKKIKHLQISKFILPVRIVIGLKQPLFSFALVTESPPLFSTLSQPPHQPILPP
jgi:hypothetical protein